MRIEEQHLPGDLAKITFEVANHVLFQYNAGGFPAGTFTRKLLDLMGSADFQNKAKLGICFPEYALAINIIESPDGTEWLRNRVAIMTVGIMTEEIIDEVIDEISKDE